MSKKKESTTAKTFKVDFHTKEFMPSNFSTNIVVQSIEENFKVSFFEVKPDIILSEEDKERIEKRGTIRADCVGSFIVSRANLKKFIDVMQAQLNKSEKSSLESQEVVPPST